MEVKLLNRSNALVHVRVCAYRMIKRRLLGTLERVSETHATLGGGVADDDFFQCSCIITYSYSAELLQYCHDDFNTIYIMTQIRNYNDPQILPERIDVEPVAIIDIVRLRKPAI